MNNLISLIDDKIINAIKNYELEKEKERDKKEKEKVGNIPLKDYNFINENMPPEFKDYSATLLYKATRDGFGGNNFHSKVDGVANTLFIGESESGERFGAFTVVPFTSCNNYKKDDSSKTFLFQLNKELISKLVSKDQAIYDRSDYGPTFGGGHNLHISNNSNTTTSSYSNPLTSHYDLNVKLFEGSQKMKELEVFRIEKK